MYVIGIELKGKIIDYDYYKVNVGTNKFLKYYRVYRSISWARKYIDSIDSYDFEKYKGGKLIVVDIDDTDIDLKMMLMRDIKYIPLSIQHTDDLSCLDIDDTYNRIRPLIKELFNLLKETDNKNIVNQIYMNLLGTNNQKYKKDRTLYEKKIEVIQDGIDKIKDSKIGTFGDM